MPTPALTTPSFSVLTANVGNLNVGCLSYLNKLCDVRIERRIAANIQTLRPDIVVLQEVLAPWQCFEDKNPNRVCHHQFQEPQVRRLVGRDYTIVCEPRHQFECIAVHVDAGIVVGCEPSAFCTTARSNPPVDGCDNGFTVSAATVRLNDGAEFDIVNVHPQSTDAACRAAMIDSAFAPAGSPMIRSPKVMILGDFNLDPWRDEDVSATTWREHFDRGWGGRAFHYHSGSVEHMPPRFTAYPFRRTLDFMVSNFAAGIGVVLGESPGTTRLDGGRGTDHRAIWAVLTYE